MNRRTLAFRIPCLLLLAVAAACASTPRRVTTQSLLQEMTNTAEMARWPQPSFRVDQASSYDRATKTPDDAKGWFANSDHSQFIRDEVNGGRSEHVLLDVDGPGALVRVWFTCRFTTDTLRIYLDGASEPAIEGTMKDLIRDGKFVGTPLAIENGKPKTGTGGLNIHLPIPYAKHCKVTWSAGPKQSRYYNLEYRTYPKGTAVESYSPAKLAELRPLIEQTNKMLLNPPAPEGQITKSGMNIEAGGSAELDLPKGPAAVNQLELKLAAGTPEALERTLRDLVVCIAFDGKVTVWSPAGDFFGSGVGLNELKSWYRTVDQGGTLTCRWVMPYRHGALVKLFNYGKQPVVAQLAATTGNWKWDSRSLYFHAGWRQERGIPTRPFQDWNYITVAGKGIYLGDTLSVFNPVRGWWGEGDEKIYQDGETFPSHIGTGSEDYYGYAWCSPVLFQGPYSNQVRCDGPGNMGHTTVSRVRALDRLPFEKSIKYEIEVWSSNAKANVDYAVTTYWYGTADATSNRTPQPEEAAAVISQVAK